MPAERLSSRAAVWRLATPCAKGDGLTQRPTATAIDKQYTPQARPDNTTKASIGGAVGGRVQRWVGQHV